MILDHSILRRRLLLESSFNVLKNSMNLEHSRHRFSDNFLVHIVVCLCSYVCRRILFVRVVTKRNVPCLS